MLSIYPIPPSYRKQSHFALGQVPIPFLHRANLQCQPHATCVLRARFALSVLPPSGCLQLTLILLRTDSTELQDYIELTEGWDEYRKMLLDESQADSERTRNNEMLINKVGSETTKPLRDSMGVGGPVCLPSHLAPPPLFLPTA